MLIIITFYAGELVWRERDTRLDQIHDALPMPTWLPLVAQARRADAGAGRAAGGADALRHRRSRPPRATPTSSSGCTSYDLFGIELVDYWLVCVLALTVHSLVNHKYLGHFVDDRVLRRAARSRPLGFEHNLYKYGSVPAATSTPT